MSAVEIPFVCVLMNYSWNGFQISASDTQYWICTAFIFYIFYNIWRWKVFGFCFYVLGCFVLGFRVFFAEFYLFPLNLQFSGQVHLGGSKCNSIDSTGILSAYVSDEFVPIFIGNTWAAVIWCGKSCWEQIKQTGCGCITISYNSGHNGQDNAVVWNSVLRKIHSF